MDSNGTRFVLLNNARDFQTADNDCVWDSELGAFALARDELPRLPRLPLDQAQSLWRNATPYVVDDHGQIGRLSADRRRFEFALAWPNANWQIVRANDNPDALHATAADALLHPITAPAGTHFCDLDLGGSGLVALPFSDEASHHGLFLVHLRHRWQIHCALSFAPKRAWVDHQDRVWIVGDSDLALCRGAPLPQPYQPQAHRFEPVEINPDPLRVVMQQRLPANSGVIALSASEENLALLVKKANEEGRQQIFTRPLRAGADAPFTIYDIPQDLPFATDMMLLSPKRLLLLPPLEEGTTRADKRDCPLLQLALNKQAEPSLRIVPERWPRRSESSVRFVHHRDRAPRTLTEEGVVPLHRLAQAHFLHEGSAILTEPLDAGAPGTVWHRIYLEARIPSGCRVEIHAQTSEVRDACSDLWQQQPEPLWLPVASEIPFAVGARPPLPRREGLFELLLQRANGEVRDLAGRYLRLKITLTGDGRHTPAIFALRAWYPRFSWQANYLPNHFQQQAPLPPQPPALPEAANGADFRERLLACFEGLLTPIEDRIAAAETLLYPNAAPTEYLPRLAQMIGGRLPAHWPEPRHRRWLEEQARLQRHKGTFGGLCQALDIITDGGVRRGEVVPVEMFRLRRTFATVLGIDMSDERHPLTLGTGQSGNSIVGESLILAADHGREFLALFAPELAQGKTDAAAVEQFFDECARRVVVVLHGEARQQRHGIAQALPQLVPAILQWKLVESDHPFVLGLSPLLRIDTYLEKEPAPGRVLLDSSQLGRGHLIQNPVALAPEYLASRT